VIISTIPLSLALAGCAIQPALPMAHALRAPAGAPTISWPESQEHPEKTEPPHGEGSGESLMFGGLAAYTNSTVSVSGATVMVDSGASGILPYASVAWLPNSFPLIVSPQDFQVVERFVATPQNTIQIAPNTTKHLSNPTTIHLQRAVTRRRR
jgi:hypothetical protein